MKVDLTPEVIDAIVHLQASWQDYEDAMTNINDTVIDASNEELDPQRIVSALYDIRLIGRAIRPIYNDKR